MVRSSRKRAFYRLICGLFFTAIILGSSITSTFATVNFPTGRENEFSENNIVFYNPDGSSSSSCAPSSISISGGGTPTGTKREWIIANHAAAEKLSIEFGIPWEAVMAQGVLESTYGTSWLAKNKNNFFGIKAYDNCSQTCSGSPDKPSPICCATTFASPEEGWRGYYTNIANTRTYRDHGVFQGNTITDPYSYLQAVKNAGYASDPNYVSSVGTVVKEVENLSKEQGWKTSAELASEHPEMKENAKKYSAGAGATPVGTSNTDGSGSSADCVNDPSGTGDGGSTDPTESYNGDEFPYYNQCDQAWGNTPYGASGTTCSSGCGPSSFAMMATALTGMKITPDMTTKVAGDAGMHVCSLNNGKYSCNGSSWSITKVLANHYGLQVKQINISQVDQYLRDGWMIHTSGKGSMPFTKGGHYIGIRGITSDGRWLIADSGHSKENTTSKSWDKNSVISAGLATGNLWAIKK